MIRALQSGCEVEIQKYTALEIAKAALVQNEKINVENEATIISKVTNNDELMRLQQLIDILKRMGIGEDIAPVVAEQAILELPDGNLFELVTHR